MLDLQTTLYILNHGNPNLHPVSELEEMKAALLVAATRDCDGPTATTYANHVTTINETIAWVKRTTPVKAEGYAYDAATRDWTKRVEYVARNAVEAADWVRCNREWLKSARVMEENT